MSLLTIIIIGIILLALIAFWANRNDENFQEGDKPIKLTPMEIVEKFDNLNFDGGTLRIWGKWFGKPYDNFHEIEKIKFDENNNQLEIIFDEKEILTILKPSKIIITEKEFKIRSANQIKFEWYLYGEKQTKENFKFESYINKGISIKYESNFHLKNMITNTKITEPALRIIKL